MHYSLGYIVLMAFLLGALIMASIGPERHDA